MKIVCENCGAKYSIADEKVKGKVFKIRCKKCSESILVRGDTPKPEPKPADEGEPETRVFDYGKGHSGGAPGETEEEAIWHIVVEDQQQGPYTDAQIREYLAAGSITADTLIWREGFEDWMSVRDVPEFSGSAASSGGALFDEQPAAATAGGALFDEQPGGGLFSGNADTTSPFDSGGGLFGDNAGGDVFSSTAPAQEAPPAQSGGLFGGDSQSDGIFAAGDSGNTGEGIFSAKAEPAAAPSPRVSAEQAMLTGQRNENSVLFSLSNLQALAAAPSKDSNQPDAPTSMPMGGAGGEEASGLIDIRSLAGSLSTAEQNDSVDELISMSAGGFSPALGAPVLAAQHTGMSTGMKFGIIGSIVVGLVALVVVLVVVISGDDSSESEARIQALQKQIEELSKQGGSTAQIAALEAKIVEEKEEEAAAKNSKGEDKEKTAAVAEKDVKKDDKSSGSSSRHRKSTSRSKKPSSSSSSSKTAAASAEPEKKEAAKPKRNSTSELDDLLGGATRSKPKSKTASKPSSSSSSSGGGVKASLSRSDVQSGMNRVSGAVKRCGQGKGGTITMNVMIGKTGRVSSASATGAFAGTPIGSCAARAVRRAKFPASQKSLNVKYPFKL